MKNILNIVKKGVLAVTLISTAASLNAAEINGWGDFKLYIDPGHSTRENQGLYRYSEAEKVLRVAWAIRDNLKKYTDIPEESIKLCRETDEDYIDLTERVDVANAWDADFYYSIHSDASGSKNETVFLFGGWKNNGVEIEKTPNGGKKFGDILDPNLSGVMRIPSRGNWYDRSFYEKGIATHGNQYPYLAVNRRSNMPSLLSEGGYHTDPDQQPRNMNDSYKRLEGYAAFRAILEYRGLEKPVQPLLVGIIKNSENQVPINGVTITVGDKSITTDTYESLFNKYTPNPNLIHNGFYMFEDLEAGKEYDVVFSSDEYGTQTKKVTIVSNPTGTAAENVTWCDLEMTSKAPARIDATSIEDPTGVSLREDIVLTFSRNMNKPTVEEAFSIDNNGQCTLSWDNDYTLRINISKLIEDVDYTITIDGSIAKNTQTDQFLDGIGDGTEGSNYVLAFKTLPPDFDPPVIASTTPAENSTMLYTNRPVIRVEFSEELNWNDDNHDNIITVVDAGGKSYSGTLKHEVISKASVLQLYLNEDLPLDKCILVNVAGGLPDLAGNISEAFQWKFLTEYRPVLSSETVDALSNIDGWYQPHGSGSSKGWTVVEENTMTTTTSSSNLARTCFSMMYAFDPTFIDQYWQLRIYKRPGTLYPDNEGILQTYVFGDGSNNGFAHCVRANSGSGGVKYQTPKPITFRGWDIMTWQMNDDSYVDLSGTDKLTGKWMFDSFFIKHEDTGDDEEIPQQAWTGSLRFDDLKYVKYDNNAVQTATLEDIGAVEGVNDVTDIIITQNNGNISVTSKSDIANVAIYSVSGEQVIEKAPNTTYCNISTGNLVKGVYIIKIKSETGAKTKKVIF